MNYYLLKATVLVEGKVKKEPYVCKADSSISAETTTSLNLAHKELQEIPDNNKKNWVDVITNGLGGDWYDIVCEWTSIEGKVLKDAYLIQALSSEDAMLAAHTASKESEITLCKKTNIIDYFIQEEV